MTNPLLEVCILAAGMGTRMHSSVPKFLHQLGGKPLLAHLLQTVQRLDPAVIHVVIGPEGKKAQEMFTSSDVNWVTQRDRRGTGHAVQQIMPAVGANSKLLILPGDAPLVSFETLSALISVDSVFTLLTAQLDDPSGYGRIIRRDSDLVAAIVEDRDATDEEKCIHEINTGMMAVLAGYLATWLPRLKDDNAQKELLLTDIVALANQDKLSVKTLGSKDPLEVSGINTQEQLAAMERALQCRINKSDTGAGSAKTRVKVSTCGSRKSITSGKGLK